jgi:hypothetical protein
MYILSPSRLGKRAYRDRHDTRGGDAVGVSGCSVVFHADEQSDAHGEIAWS